MYDYSKLRGRIYEKYGTQTAFNEAMGWKNRQSISYKLRGKTPFKQDEIYRAISLLDIDNPIPYFFTQTE